MEEIVDNLKREVAKGSEIAKICLHRIQQAPPALLKATLELLRRSKVWDYTTCMQQEYAVLWNSLRRADFETAMAHRKQRMESKWHLFSPSTLEEVTPAMVDQMLKPAPDMMTENPA